MWRKQWVMMWGNYTGMVAPLRDLADFSNFSTLTLTAPYVSTHHLYRYLGEFDYRYNTCKIKDDERTLKAIRMTAGKRLMYRAS